jgi:hypothetical protein
VDIYATALDAREFFSAPRRACCQAGRSLNFRAPTKKFRELVGETGRTEDVASAMQRRLSR